MSTLLQKNETSVGFIFSAEKYLSGFYPFFVIAIWTPENTVFSTNTHALILLCASLILAPELFVALFIKTPPVTRLGALVAAGAVLAVRPAVLLTGRAGDTTLAAANGAGCLLLSPTPSPTTSNCHAALAVLALHHTLLLTRRAIGRTGRFALVAANQHAFAVFFASDMQPAVLAFGTRSTTQMAALQFNTTRSLAIRRCRMLVARNANCAAATRQRFLHQSVAEQTAFHFQRAAFNFNVVTADHAMGNFFTTVCRMRPWIARHLSPVATLEQFFASMTTLGHINRDVTLQAVGVELQSWVEQHLLNIQVFQGLLEHNQYRQ